MKLIKRFAKYALGTIIRPRATFRELALSRPMGQGWIAVLLLGILYAVACIIATREAPQVIGAEGDGNSPDTRYTHRPYHGSYNTIKESAYA